jgi:four helix bundle suffix protein
MDSEPLIPRHGGYRNLKSFQLAQLVYDITVGFCEEHVDRHSRTHDQMVQAARSGVQNIAEGSQASGTSKKTELKLTNVARASLEELCLDYEDFLRQRGLERWSPQHPALQRFKARRCASLDGFQGWLEAERALPEQGKTDEHGHTRTATDSHGLQAERRPMSFPGSALHSAQFEANAVLSLLNLCCHLLDRQIEAQATAFEREGGFTERLYHVRQARRQM